MTQFTAEVLVAEGEGGGRPLWQGRTMLFDHNDHYHRLLLRQVPRNGVRHWMSVAGPAGSRVDSLTWA